MPPKKRNQTSSPAKKKRKGRPPLAKNLKKKKNPWDSGGSSEDEPQYYEDNNYYSESSDEDDVKRVSDGFSDVEIVSDKNKSKVSVIDGLEPELGDEDGDELDDEMSEISSISNTKLSSIECFREKRCVWLEDRDVPQLDVPETSEDLLMPAKLVLRALEIYEICRRFGSIVRLSPFLFEDFCSTLNSSTEQSPLLDEIHIAFLKLLLKEDEKNQTIYGAHDARDSVNVSLYHLDFMTYGEVLRRYVESDERFGVEIVDALSNCNYPFVDVEKRLIVLKWLCDQFLTTAVLRDELAAEGVIKHDDHCRECGKTGDLLCCDTCSAVYHLGCVEPPLKETPATGWQCVVCKLHILPGVTDCVSELEKTGQLIRQGFLGYDRHGRSYWFLCRRIFVEDVTAKQTWYYSTLAQFRQLLMYLDANDYERDLCDLFSQFSKEILRGLEMNEQLTDKRKGNKISWFSVDKPKRMQVLGGDGIACNSQPTELLLKVNNVLNESFEEMKKLGVNEGAHVELEDFSTSGIDGLAAKIPIRSAMKIESKMVESDTSIIFKLGMDRACMKYDNLFTSNSLATNPYLRAEQRKLDKYMSNRFSLEGDAEYKWPKELMNSSEKCARFIRTALIIFASRLPVTLMHPLWGKDILLKWKQGLNESSNVKDFAKAVMKFESNIKPLVFNDSYKHSLGHTKFSRQTAEDKEERRLNDKAKQKKQQLLAERLSACDPSDENSSVIWVKYSLLDGPPKHEIWKLKDEQYRVNGLEALGGWIWVRSHRSITYTSFRNFGLYTGPAWESSHSSMIEEMLKDFRNGVFHYDRNENEYENDFVDDQKPACADLPTQLDEEMLNLEINRPRAAAKLGLHHHLDTINVSLAIRRHSLYFKVAKGSKFLDKLLSAREHQEEKVKTLTRSFNCYSPKCTTNGGSVTCYSYACRSRFVTNERRTKAKHRLKLNDVNLTTKTNLDEDKILRTPPLHFFCCRRSQKLNIFILPKHVARKLARCWWSNEEISGFNSNCKANLTFWPYPCIRPSFYTCWRYQIAGAESFHAVALMLRVLFSSIRWTDVLKNVGLDARRSRRFEEYTETREIVKHKSLPPFGLSSSYMARVICVPHEYRNGGDYSDDTSDEDYDPHNTPWKLRERRKEKERLMNKNKNNKKPTVHVQWIREEDLVMWEVRNYWSMLDKKIKLKEFEAAKRLNEATEINFAVKQSPSMLARSINSPRLPGITVKSNILRTPMVNVSRTPTTQTSTPTPLRVVNRPIAPATSTSGGPRYLLAGNKLITVNNSNIISSSGSNISTPGVSSAARPNMIYVVRTTPGGQPAIRLNVSNVPVVKKLLHFGDSANVAIRPNLQQQAPFIQPSRTVQPVPNVFLSNGGDSMLSSSSSLNVRTDSRQIAEEHGFVLTPSAIQQAIKKGLLGADNKETKNKLLTLKKQTTSFTSPEVNNKWDNFEEGEYFESDEEDEYDDDEGDDFDNMPIPSLQAVHPPPYRRPAGRGAQRIPRGTQRVHRGRPTPRRVSNAERFAPVGQRKMFDDDLFADTIENVVSSVKLMPRRDDNYRLEGEMNRVDRKIYLVDKVCEKEKSEKKVEKRQLSSELRRQYWKRYRVKRKIKLQYEDQISTRLARWRKEILKRRQQMEMEMTAIARKELENGGLEALKDAVESKRQKRLQSPKAHGDRKHSELKKYKPMKKSAHMKLSTSAVKLDVGKIKKSTPKTAPRVVSSLIPYSTLPQHEDKPREVVAPDTSCSCKRPYDPTKFYVGCDLCSRYFHGKCVGVTSQISKRLTSWYCPDCQRERQNAKQELYCICRTPYDESQFYISCDVCDLWFHGVCVGITPDEGEDIPAFICQECSRNQNGTIQPMIKPLTNQDIQRANEVIDLLEKHKMSWPFRRGVDYNKHPKYLRIVQEPMDLNIIRRKMSERRYRCLAELTNDVSLIFNNARKYFPPESAEFQCATVLDRYFSDRLHELKQEMLKELKTSPS